MSSTGRIASGLPALSCPSCGGRTAPGPAGRYDCTYCGGHFLNAGGAGVPTLAPHQQLGASTALHRARRWLDEQALAADPPVRPADICQLYVPYWRWEAMLAGWILGLPQRPAAPPASTPRRRAGAARQDLGSWLGAAGRAGEGERLAAFLAARGSSDGARPAGDEVDVGPQSSAILRKVSWSGPGCDVREFGLVGIHQLVADETLVPFDFQAAERSGAICQVAGSVATARRQAARAVANQLGAGARVLKRRTAFIRERIELIYYPLFRVKYRSGGLRCRLVLDGLRGHVLAGTRPVAGQDRRLGMLGGIAAWGGLLAAHTWAGLASVPLLYLLDATRAGQARPPLALARGALEACAPRPPLVRPF